MKLTHEELAAGGERWFDTRLNDFLTEAGYFNTNAGQYGQRIDPATKTVEYDVTFDSSAWTAHEPHVTVNPAMRQELLDLVEEGRLLLADNPPRWRGK